VKSCSTVSSSWPAKHRGKTYDQSGEHGKQLGDLGVIRRGFDDRLKDCLQSGAFFLIAFLDSSKVALDPPDALEVFA
jgi:hypothetical protein